MMVFAPPPARLLPSMPSTLRLPSPSRALTLLETIIALALIAVLLSILLPALTSARVTSQRDQCAANLADVGQAWQAYLADHEKQFPHLPLQPAWHYGGMRFSGIDGAALPDFNRPLTQYLDVFKTRDYASLCVCCPADRGIAAPASEAATASRSAFESYGTSYRANATLMDARLAGLADESRGMRRSEITAFPAALILCGDPVWYEVAESTGRSADWHGVANAGNLLFLDGHVQFVTVRPKGAPGPIVIDPLGRGSRAWPQSEPATRADEAAPNAPPAIDR